MEIQPVVVTSHVLAWTAGVVDGEGCIVIAKANRGLKNPHYKMQVQVAMCHKPTIERLYSLYGGSVTARKSHGNNRASWTWTIFNNQAKQFLQHLLPFLVTKRDEASVAITFQESINNTPRCGCRGLTDNTLAQREALYQECKRLKKLEWADGRV